MNEIPKRSKLWHISRWLLIGIAVVATIGASVLTEENWRARRAWEKYKRDAEARGERLEWAAYTQTNAPDEQNFFKAPIFSALTAAQWDERAQDWKPEDTNTVDRSKMSPWRSDGSSPDGAGGDWAQGRLTDLKAWQDYYRSPATNAVGQFPVAAQPRTPAVDVLLALSKYDSAIEELRQAARRPYAQLDLYDIHNNQKATLMLRYDATLKSCAQVLQLRAIAELADGQDAKALDDVKLLLRLENILRQQPTYM